YSLRCGSLLCRGLLCPRRDLNVCPHHADFVILLVEIMQEKVAKRDKTLQSNPVADGQMPKSVLPHQQHTSLCFFLRAYGEGLGGHNVADPRLARIPPS